MKKLNLLALFLFFAFFLHAAEPVGDTWWTLRVGQEIIAGEPLFVEHWSWTAAGAHNPNHEWLWSVILYGAWRAGQESLALVYLLQATLLTLPFALARPSTQLATRMKVKPSIVGACYVLALPCLAYLNFATEMRAQLATFGCFAVLHFLTRRERWIWIPALFLLWANLHAGFLAGFFALFMLTCYSLLLYATDRTSENRTRVGKISLTVLVSFLASLVNPLGIGVWTYILDNARKSSTANIVEWQHAWFLPDTMIFWSLVLSVAILTAVILRSYVKDWEVGVSLCLTAGFLLLGLWVIRFLPFSFIAVLPLLSLAPALIKGSKAGKITDAVTAAIDALPKLALAAVTVLALIVAGGLTISKVQAEQAIGIRPATVRALDQCGLSYNDYNSGAFLLWWAPDHKVFQDNRWDPYPESVLWYTDLTRYNIEDFRKDWTVDCVFAGNYSTTARTMDELGWDERYTDGAWTIWKVPSQQ